MGYRTGILVTCCGVAAAYQPQSQQAQAWQYESTPILAPVNDTTSLIPHPGCKTPDPRGYLLYLAFGQQFNNQLISIAENMLLARQLGRVLILTGFLEQVSAEKTSDGRDYFDSERALKPFEMAFDKNASFEGNGMHAGDVITLDEFKQLCPNQPAYPNMVAQAHVFVPDWEPDVWEKGYYLAYNASYYLPQHMYECCDHRCCGPYSVPNVCSDCGQRGWNNRWNGAVAKHLPMFREVWQIAHGHNHVLELSSLPSGQQVPVLIFDGLYYKFNATNPRYAQGSDAVFEAIRHFQWNASISGRAEAFTRQKYDGKPYIALHWRRGFSGGAITIRSMSEVIGLLRSASEENRNNVTGELPQIYIASNQLTWKDMATIHSKLPGKQMIASLVLDDPQDLDLNALSRVEMAICQKARYFIPAPGSTWSMNVNALRGTSQEQLQAVGRDLDTRISVRRDARNAAVASGKVMQSSAAEGTADAVQGAAAEGAAKADATGSEVKGEAKESSSHSMRGEAKPRAGAKPLR